jgi:hypothetical protein
MDLALYALQIAIETISLATVGGLGLVAVVGSIILFAMGAPD